MLNLAHWGFPKHLRRWFWKTYLDELDQTMVWAAHRGIDKFATTGQGRYFMEKAAGNGYLNLFIWMRGGRPYSNWEWRFQEAAACNGHLNILKWMKQTEVYNPTFNIFLFAAKGRHFHIIEWTIENNTYWNKGLIRMNYNEILPPDVMDWINKHM